MTVQPELDLEHGLATSVPTKNEKSRCADYTLAINPLNCVPLNTKVEDVPYKASASVYITKNSGIYRSGRIAFRISLDETENPKFNLLADLAARRTYLVSDDERLAVMRKCLINASRIALANGLVALPSNYTMDDLHRLKGFKWSWKAGCSMCPCSPAFTTPFLKTGDWCNWFDFSFKVKEPVNVVYDFARIADPTLKALVKEQSDTADCGGIELSKPE